MRSHACFWFVGVSVLILDQASKAWARGAFAEHQAPGYPWPGVFEFTLTFNKGIAFGLLPGIGTLLAPIAAAIAIGCWIYSYRHQAEGLLTHVAMALLGAGALGNLYDRLIHGKVTDMLWFRAVEFPVFNVADSSITVAAAILLLKWAAEFAPNVGHKPAGPSASSGLDSATPGETAPNEGQ